MPRRAQRPLQQRGLRRHSDHLYRGRQRRSQRHRLRAALAVRPASCPRLAGSSPPGLLLLVNQLLRTQYAERAVCLKQAEPPAGPICRHAGWCVRSRRTVHALAHQGAALAVAPAPAAWALAAQALSAPFRPGSSAAAGVATVAATPVLMAPTPHSPAPLATPARGSVGRAPARPND